MDIENINKQIVSNALIIADKLKWIKLGNGMYHNENKDVHPSGIDQYRQEIISKYRDMKNLIKQIEIIMNEDVSSIVIAHKVVFYFRRVLDSPTTQYVFGKDVPMVWAVQRALIDYYKDREQANEQIN